MTPNNANAFQRQLESDGFAIFPVCLDGDTVKRFRREFGRTEAPQRNLLSLPSIRALVTSKSVREIVEAALGPRCFAVRGLFFNKTPNENWKVVWHQDLTIAVSERREAVEFGPWTTKGGVPHVQAPAEILRDILAIRLHLDESGPDNGPLRVLPGSHVAGRLSAERISSWDKKDSVICTVPKGGALVMHPLLLHASSACSVLTPRRVIHIEFAAGELPHGLDWHTKISCGYPGRNAKG